MNRADARAAEHGHGGFGNHRHVNRHAVALLDAERFQDVGELADLRVQFRVGDALHVLLRFALPDDGGLVAVAVLRWRSRQLTVTLSWPSSNQVCSIFRASVFQSNFRATVGCLNQSSVCACSSQNLSGSRMER